ncbi:MAG: hypothetical protein IIB27_09815 [Chloroflexi bacterium]|nr:hypothetical protein [Chloroflexota bacterium]
MRVRMPGCAWSCDVLDRIRHHRSPVTGLEAGVILLSLAVVISQVVIALV